MAAWVAVWRVACVEVKDDTSLFRERYLVRPTFDWYHQVQIASTFLVYCKVVGLLCTFLQTSALEAVSLLPTLNPSSISSM